MATKTMKTKQKPTTKPAPKAAPKAKKTTPKSKPSKPALSSKQVLAYLQAHPNFLETHAQTLAAHAQAPKKVGNIFALHAARAGAAESRLGGLMKRLTQFTAIAKANAEATAQAHAAVLALLEGAASPASFRKALQGPFKTVLGIHQARLMLAGPTTTATTLSAADMKKLCAEPLWLGPIDMTHHALFGPQTATLRSGALLRLGGDNRPLGLLAMASENPQHFHAGQATDLLEFLRGASSHILALWPTPKA